ncbi:MAG: 4-hydroxy-tetrahydrodipicolinate synthase [Moritella sp.]|uniref:4-hydroxy-tetrahydrodipicolinate synthase n=1 Tax=unclassified Moritella TaxID=2637987 RepID=UPI0001568238|nr:MULTISPECIES: 4-hydroxy-tetrahydrodipicolinate synthase [unclassified Moritella]EDM67483.1 dihydrodipicolinate synthase [Moritella sp. PE36]MBL1416348.1 4-hydroxy-tetrahydrodipicolinate synthase [Moritella sp.]PHR88088.1 MAG: 4-hydroxy-tetrahydrodipicolinate synthase [Moritella sp.]
MSVNSPVTDKAAMKALLKGSIVALVTPFKNNKIDEPALRNLVDWHVEQGTHGIVAVGTTGECPTLSLEEHCQILDIVVSQAAGRLPVIAGAGSNNPTDAIMLSNHAQAAGAIATLHVAGYYNRPCQEGLFQHFKAINDNNDLPIIVYNIPGRAIVDIQPETLARMAELKNVVGIKDATGDLSRPWLERQLIKGDFSFLSGDDCTTVAYNVSGGNGLISVSANVAPKLYAQVQELTFAGKYNEARELQDRLITLHSLMFKETSPAGVKYAVSLLGLCEPECRLPVIELTQGTKDEIRAAMVELELI